MHDESVLSLILMHPELGAQTKGHSSWQWCVSMTWQQAWNTDSLPCSPPPLLPPSPAQLLLDPVPIFFLLLIEPCVSFSVPLMSLCSEGDVLKGQVDAHWRRLFKWKAHQQINKRNKHGELTHEHQQRQQQHQSLQYILPTTDTQLCLLYSGAEFSGSGFLFLVVPVVQGSSPHCGDPCWSAVSC